MERAVPLTERRARLSVEVEGSMLPDGGEQGPTRVLSGNYTHAGEDHAGTGRRLG